MLVMVARRRDDCSVISCLLEAAASWDSKSRICCFSKAQTFDSVALSYSSLSGLAAMVGGGKTNWEVMHISLIARRVG